jgi:hypothetical protein
MTAWKGWMSLTDVEQVEVKQEHPNIPHADCMYLRYADRWDYMNLQEMEDELAEAEKQDDENKSED